jgi:hypothetical protein
MGAVTEKETYGIPKGGTYKDTYNAVVQDALYMNGHSGYSGTIAESSGVKRVGHEADRKTAEYEAQAAIDSEGHWTSVNGKFVEVKSEKAKYPVPEKWEEALAITFGPDKNNPIGVVFYGTYSS